MFFTFTLLGAGYNSINLILYLLHGRFIERAFMAGVLDTFQRYPLHWRVAGMGWQRFRLYAVYPWRYTHDLPALHRGLRTPVSDTETASGMPGKLHRLMRF